MRSHAHAVSFCLSAGNCQLTAPASTRLVQAREAVALVAGLLVCLSQNLLMSGLRASCLQAQCLNQSEEYHSVVKVSSTEGAAQHRCSLRSGSSASHSP